MNLNHRLFNFYVFHFLTIENYYYFKMSHSFIELLHFGFFRCWRLGVIFAFLSLCNLVNLTQNHLSFVALTYFKRHYIHHHFFKIRLQIQVYYWQSTLYFSFMHLPDLLNLMLEHLIIPGELSYSNRLQ